MPLVGARFPVACRQNLHQLRQPLAQSLDFGDRVGRALRFIRIRPDAFRQVSGMIVHLLKQVLDQRIRVFGM